MNYLLACAQAILILQEYTLQLLIYINERVPEQQEEIKLKKNIAILSCNHIYHVGCIKNWLMIKNECAVCRARAIPDENI
ncbi:hypothetical protein KFK09_011584 [Dendrobium nobile]|uniref:RING-type E3 ubiquitin transferase n=1 Tax=Dendrobium nobile TaxID=94219 RepID=A0A8T3BIK7_DENNO|nr:hypothetical protein KFK09_011584 [Dendrobium nobile]